MPDTLPGEPSAPRPPRTAAWAAALVLVAAAGALAAFVYLRAQEREGAVAAWRGRLDSLADARKGALISWLAERRADAEVLAWDSDLVGVCLETVCPRGVDVAATRGHLENYVRYRGLLGAFLFGPDGVELVSAEHGMQACPDIGPAARQVALQRRFVLDDVRRGEDCGDLMIGFLAPVFRRAGPQERSEGEPVVGVVGLYLRPEETLFPLVAGEAVGGEAIDLYLVRRDGEGFRIVSPPGLGGDTAWGEVRRGDLGSLEGAAVSGGYGFGLYRDFRGRRVLGAFRRIPETPWSLVVKVDEESALAPWRREAFQKAALGALGALCVALFVVAGWRTWAARRYRFLMDGLRIREERLRALAHGTEDLVFVKDREGRYLLVNPSSARLLGREADEILGRRVSDLLPPEVAAPLEAHDRQALEEGRPFQGEETIPMAGGPRTFLAARIPLRDSEGRVQGVAGVLRDITERKNSEEILSRRAQSLATLYRLSEDFSRARGQAEVIASLLGGAVDGLDCDGAAAALKASPAGILAPAGTRGVPASLWEAAEGGQTGGAAARVWRTGVPEYLEDRPWGPGADPELDRYRTAAFVPLQADGQVLGLLGVVRRERRPFGRDERDALESLVHMAAMALSRARAEEAMRQEAAERLRAEHRLRRLYETTAGLSGKALFGAVARALSQELGTRWVEISRLGAPGRAEPLAVFRDGEEIRGASFALDEAPCGEVVSRGATVQRESGVWKAFPENGFLTRHRVEFYLGTPLCDSQGRVMGVLCAFHDAPRSVGDTEKDLLALYGRRVAGEVERLQTAQRLAEATRTLDTLIQNLPGAVYRCSADAERAFSYVSSGCLPITDHPPEAFLGERGLRLGELVVPEDRVRVARELDAALAAGRSYVLEYRIHDRGGHLRWIYDVGRPVEGPEGRGVLEGVLLDQTDRRTLEAQLTHSQRMEALGRLAGGVAHDFNNLLTAISGYAELLQRRVAADERSSKAVQEICRASDRAAALTRQLLAFSRKQAIEPRLLDLGEEVRGVIGMLGRLLGEDVKLSLDLWREPIPLRLDAGQLGQVVLNLCVNARDAMPEGGVLTVRTLVVPRDAAPAELAANPGVHAVLEVSDTGSGMEAGVVEHIFEPFFTTKEPGRGTGLGLATVYGIVRQAGGAVRVETAPGRGSTFRVFWPLHRGTPSAEARSVEPDARPGAGRIVLLAEDEASVRQLTTEYLEDVGYAVTAAGGGAEALEAAAGLARIDVLVTDVVMPGLGGPSLAKALRERLPGLPVVFMSGHPGETVLEKGAEGPGTAFLQKPFLLSALSAAVEKALGQ